MQLLRIEAEQVFPGKVQRVVRRGFCRRLLLFLVAEHLCGAHQLAQKAGPALLGLNLLRWAAAAIICGLGRLRPVLLVIQTLRQIWEFFHYWLAIVLIVQLGYLLRVLGDGMKLRDIRG